MSLRVVSLCSGVGLLDLGLEWAGHTTVQLCELEPYATKVLERRFPGVPVHGDVWTIEPEECDVIAAGFPCQPFSVAGKRLGSNDPRHLWPAIWRAIAIRRPRYVILENVPGITAWHAAPRTGDTCICGWSDRRRGLRLHREVTRPLTRTARRRRDDESGDGSSPVAPLIRWHGKGVSSSDGYVGCRVHVDSDGIGGRSVPLGGASLSTSQASSGRARFAVSGDPRVTGQGWWAPSSMDGGVGEMRHAAASNPGTEPEGPQGRGASWRRVCSACGRRMGGPTVEFVRRSGIGEVLEGLAAIGFDAEWTVFGASDVGAHHRRKRWWCVATSDPDRSRVWDTDGGFFREAWATSALTWAHGQARHVADADGDRCVEGLWWWSTERGLGRVAHGQPHRMDRLRCLGNGVVPQCAELIGLRIRQLEGPYGQQADTTEDTATLNEWAA